MTTKALNFTLFILFSEKNARILNNCVIGEHSRMTLMSRGWQLLAACPPSVSVVDTQTR